MSFDPNQNTPPMGHVPPKKKGGSLKWILGGLGCFGLLILLCVGGVAGVGYWGMGLLTNEGYERARTSIATSEEVGDAVGRPVVVGTFDPANFQQTQKGAGEIEYTYQLTVQGSEKSGTAEAVVSGNPIEGNWKVESIEVDVDGEKITVGEVELDVNIEGE